MAQRGHRTHRKDAARPRRLRRNQDLGHDGPVHRRVRGLREPGSPVGELEPVDSHRVGNRCGVDAHRSRDQSGVQSPLIAN